MADDSEFMCEIVVIKAVENHPNADRLSLATFITSNGTEFPYKIVTGRDEFKPGTAAIYISPDSDVPLSGSFEFLKTRLDVAGKTRYRIRSAKLRGLFSPGLLIPYIEFGLNIGDDCSAELDVKPWVSGEEIAARERQEKHLANKVYKLPDRYPQYTITALKKVPDLFTPGELVSITEKIHGTNFRFGYGGGSRFFYGTHRTALSDTRGLLRRVADFFRRRKPRINSSPGFGNPWGEAVEKFALDESSAVFPDLVFYGELFGVTASNVRVQDLTYGQRDLQLRIFDCWHGSERRWLSADERERVLAVLSRFRGFTPVVEIYRGEFQMESVKQMAEADSTFGGIREGVVIESLSGDRRKGKWVSQRYHLRADDAGNGAYLKQLNERA